VAEEPVLEVRPLEPEEEEVLENLKD